MTFNENAKKYMAWLINSTAATHIDDRALRMLSFAFDEAIAAARADERAKVVEECAKVLDECFSRGTGEWPKPGYVRDGDGLQWQTKDRFLRRALEAIRALASPKGDR